MQAQRDLPRSAGPIPHRHFTGSFGSSRSNVTDPAAIPHVAAAAAAAAAAFFVPCFGGIFIPGMLLSLGASLQALRPCARGPVVPLHAIERNFAHALCPVLVILRRDPRDSFPKHDLRPAHGQTTNASISDHMVVAVLFRRSKMVRIKQTPRVLMCCLHINKPFFLPNDIGGTPSVRPDSSS